jgi:hypothetical protein
MIWPQQKHYSQGMPNSQNCKSRKSELGYAYMQVASAMIWPHTAYQEMEMGYCNCQISGVFPVVNRMSDFATSAGGFVHNCWSTSTYYVRIAEYNAFCSLTYLVLRILPKGFRKHSSDYEIAEKLSDSGKGCSRIKFGGYNQPQPPAISIPIFLIGKAKTLRPKFQIKKIRTGRSQVASRTIWPQRHSLQSKKIAATVRDSPYKYYTQPMDCQVTTSLSL